MFALVDANSFFCSAEQIYQPHLRNRALVVLSNNDATVVAANRMAKEAGIEKFSKYFQIKQLCDDKGVVVLSSNYALYQSVSDSMMQIIGRHAFEQHIYSIDEIFLSFKKSGQIIPCLRTHGLKIRRAVWKEARLPVCVGIGPTLTLAKVANHYAKKTRVLAGVCVIESDEFRNSILSTMKTSDVWGVGSRIAKRLAVMNIHTALELANMNPGLARLEFSIELERTVRELNGQKCKSWDEVKAAKKQIFSTRSLGQRINNLQMLTEALSKYASIAAAKARSQGSVCSAMVVFASNSPFDEKPAGFKYFHHFSFPTNDTGQIIKVATQAATERFRSDIRYYKVGVGLIELSDAENLQSDLFEEQANPAKMVLLDELNAKYGSDTLFMAAQGIEQKWAMRRDFLSPQFTSKWSDIPIIHC